MEPRLFHQDALELGDRVAVSLLVEAFEGTYMPTLIQRLMDNGRFLARAGAR